MKHAWLVVALCALVLGAAIFGPALPGLGERFLGIEEVDYYGTLWFYWFVGHQLELGQGPMHTDLFFHPYGKDVFLHTGANVLDAYVALPLRALLGPVLGFNLFLLLTRLFDGWAFSRLARRFTDDNVAIGVSSVLFALTPFALYELAEGRPTQAILGLLPLYLLQAWKAAEEPGWRAPVLGGLLLAVMGYQYWFYAFFAGFVTIGLGLARAARPVQGSRIAVLLRLAGIAGVALALVAPLAVPLALAASGEEVPGLIDLGGWSLRELSTPTTAEGHDIALLTWQPLLRQTAFFMVSAERQPMVLGHQGVTSWVIVALVLAWFVRPGRLDRGPWLAMALAASLVALGPLLVVGGLYLVNPVYLALVEVAAFLRRLWWPGRAYALLAVLFGLAGTMALAWLGQLGRRVQVAVIAVITGAWWLDLRESGLAPMPSWDSSIPAAYECLATGPEGALIELPFGWTQAHLYYQTVHGRPVLGGMLENNPIFHPAEAIALRQDNPWLSTVLATAKAGGLDRPHGEADRDALRDLGYRYVVLQKAALKLHNADHPMKDTIQRTRTRELRRALVGLMGQPVYEDARGAIYAPWGDPDPCAGVPVEPDEKVPARRENNRTASVRDLESKNVKSLWTPPGSSD